MEKLPIMCPSGTCAPGSQLLGIIDGDGTAKLLPKALPLDEGFIEQAHAGRSPEKRFRFTQPCVQGACRQWNGAGCGIIGRVEASEQRRTTELPPCAIRPNCRWFVQRGDEACHVCPFVITDLLEEAPAPQPLAPFEPHAGLVDQ